MRPPSLARTYTRTSNGRPPDAEPGETGEKAEAHMPICDHADCGARAGHAWVCPQGEHVLTWCSHHDRERRGRLAVEGWTEHTLDSRAAQAVLPTP